MEYWFILSTIRLTLEVLISTMCSASSEQPSLFSEKFVTSGDWEFVDVNTIIDRTDHGDCCPFEFSQISYAIQMRRIPLYYWFYLVSPGLILVILALASFFIPTESGERIGFVTTLLLGMMVFLLLIPSSLPETSENIPLLGKFMMSTLIIITLVLVVTIVNLIMYFLEGTAAPALQKFLRVCSLWSRKKNRRIEAKGQAFTSPQPKNASSVAAIQLSERRLDSVASNSSSLEPSEWRPLKPEVELLSWRQASEKLDFIFFLLFFLISLITFASMFGAAVY